MKKALENYGPTLMYQHVHGSTRGEEREKGEENIFEEIMAKNLPNLLENNLHIQEAQQYPSRICSKKSENRFIIIKMLKAKDEKILKQQEKNDSPLTQVPH